MRTGMKWCVAALAAAVAVVNVGEVFAGNVGEIRANTEWQYFSVPLDMGQTLTYGGSQVLIDDITYSVDIQPNPADPEHWGNGSTQPARVPVFGIVDLEGWEEWFQTGTGIGGYWELPAPGHWVDPMLFVGGFTTNHPGEWADVQRWSSAKGDWFALELITTNPTTQIVRPFDCVAHTFYSELAAREVQLADPWSMMYDGVWSAIGVGYGVSITNVIANTSESRHYQTPHIMDAGDVLSMRLRGSAYVNVRIYVKGRAHVSGAAFVHAGVAIQ